MALTSVEEVWDAASSMKAGKAPGIDGIPPDVIKRMTCLTQMFAVLFSVMLQLFVVLFLAHAVRLFSEEFSTDKIQARLLWTSISYYCFRDFMSVLKGSDPRKKGFDLWYRFTFFSLSILSLLQIIWLFEIGRIALEELEKIGLL